MAHPGAPPAGWYVDPSGRHRARYWDGASWTTHVTDDVSADDALLAPTGSGDSLVSASVAVDHATPFDTQYVSAAAETTAGIAGAVAAIVAGDDVGGMQPAAGWYPDPTGRHEVRFWDGLAWTDRVATQGLEEFEPVGEPMYGTEAVGTAVDDLPPLETLDDHDHDDEDADDVEGRTRRGRGRRGARADGQPADAARARDAERPPTRATTAASRVASAFVLLGALVLFAGSTMAWVKVSGPRIAQQSVIGGLDGDGRVTAVIAVVLVLFGLGMLTGRFVKVGGVRVGAMGVLVAGAASLAVCGLDMSDVIERAPRLGIEAGASADFGKGLWVSFAGVAIAVAGGLLAFTDRDA